MSVIAILIGVLGVLNTMMVSVFERTREIGTLLALGWERSRIAAMILVESLLLCGVGAAIGIVMSMGLTAILSTFEVARSFVSPTVPPLVMVQGTALTLVAGLGGAILPALRAARMLPTEALRHE
jgi:putative ABC transport system permease protein